MKTLKKLFLILAMLAISYVGFSQTPVGQIRLPDRVTAITTNLPAGTTIICLSDSTYWNVKSDGMASGLTLTTGRHSVDLVVKPTNLAEGTKTTTTVPITSSTGTGATLDTADATHAGVMSASDKIKSMNTSGINSGNQILTVESATQPTTHATMTIGGAPGDTVNVSGAGINKVSTVGKSIIITGTEVDGSISNEGSISVEHSAGNAILNSNTSGSTGDTITAGTGITITGTGTHGFTINSTVSNHLLITEVFEEGTTGSTGTVHTLAHTPITPSTGMTVILNTTVLGTTQFSNNGTGNKNIKSLLPVYKYDRLSVTYTYAQ